MNKWLYRVCFIVLTYAYSTVLLAYDYQVINTTRFEIGIKFEVSGRQVAQFNIRPNEVKTVRIAYGPCLDKIFLNDRYISGRICFPNSIMKITSEGGYYHVVAE